MTTMMMTMQCAKKYSPVMLCNMHYICPCTQEREKGNYKNLLCQHIYAALTIDDTKREF